MSVGEGRHGAQAPSAGGKGVHRQLENTVPSASLSTSLGKTATQKSLNSFTCPHGSGDFVRWVTGALLGAVCLYVHLTNATTLYCIWASKQHDIRAEN